MVGCGHLCFATLLALGFEPLSGLIPAHDRTQGPQNSLGAPTEAPKAAQDRQHGAQERPETANIGTKSGPGPPADGQKRPKTASSEERSKITNIDSKSRSGSCPLEKYTYFQGS